MNRRLRISALAALLAVLCTATACSAGVSAMVTGSEEPGLRVIAPSVAGGGYDLTARSLARGWAAEGVVVDDVLVLPGSGGVVGLNRLALEQGNDRLLLVMGLGLVGALSTTPSDHEIADVTPIARLVTEPEVVLVPAASPLRTLDDLTNAWRQDPAALQFAGGSAEGGPDGLFRTQLARTVGVDPRASEYRVFDGGGELLPALLTGEDARAAALDYADTDACGDLLDIGGSQMLYRMDVAEVRHERNENLVEIDPDDYAEATPDPLRAVEFDLIADLADHHVDEMSDYVKRQLGDAARPGDEPRVVRMDRYGFLVRMGKRSARLAFPRPVTDRHDLAHLLHPILCRRCTADTAADHTAA